MWIFRSFPRREFVIMVVVEDDAIGFGAIAGETSTMMEWWRRVTMFGIIAMVTNLVMIFGRRPIIITGGTICRWDGSHPRRALGNVINEKRFSGSGIDLSLPSVGQLIVVVKCERRTTVMIDAIDRCHGR
jgi:hypothetical protein